MPGDVLLLDDGRVQLKVLEVRDSKVFTEVTVGGPLSNNKGINKLGGGLSAEALTEKTKRTFSPRRKSASIIWPSPSALRRRSHYARPAQEAGSDAKIVAKVERAEAVSTGRRWMTLSRRPTW